jgi:hypothetical protein
MQNPFTVPRTSFPCSLVWMIRPICSSRVAWYCTPVAKCAVGFCCVALPRMADVSIVLQLGGMGYYMLLTLRMSCNTSEVLGKVTVKIRYSKTTL